MRIATRTAATVFAVLLSASAFAADIAGKWKANAPGPDGQTMEIVFTLKAEGGTVTGTSSTPMGESPISNGKIEGEAISFDVDAGGMKISHKGKVTGDTMTLNVTFEGGMMPPIDLTAKRVTEQK